MSRRLIGWVAAAAVLTGPGSSLPAQQAGAPPSTGAEAFGADQLERWFDEVAPAGLRRGNIAGMVVSVVKDGVVTFRKGYGYADIARRIPMDPDRSVVRVASISKSFTATAVMQLVEAGQLDLDRDVNGYLDFVIPDAFGLPITLRHLLTHTAGFAEISYPRYQSRRSLRDHVASPPSRLYPPGELPAYSNYGIDLAGYIVERQAGMPIADYIETRILAPLGMRHSSFRMVLPDSLASALAPTYPTASEDPYAAGLMAELLPIESPSAGLSATAADMAQFLLAYLQLGRLGEIQLLRPETVAQMHAPVVVPIPGAQPIGLGWFRSDYRGVRILGHSGDGEGAHAEIKLLPEHGLGLFVAFNSSGVVEGFVPAAFALRTMLIEQFVDRFVVGGAPSIHDAAPTVTAASHSAQLAGEYLWSRQTAGDYREAFGLIGRFVIPPRIRSLPDGTIETTPALTLDARGRTQRWREIEPFVFGEVGGTARLLADVRDGAVRAVWSDQTPSYWVSLPVPRRWSAALHVPLLLGTLTVLTLVTAGWPIAALRARRRRASAGMNDTPLRSWSRAAGAMGLLYLFGWFVAMAVDLPSHPGGAVWARVLQSIGLVCIAGLAVASWNAWRVWTGRPGLLRRLEATLTALALGYLVWFSFGFHLLSRSIP